MQEDTTTRTLDEIRRERLQKYTALKDQGINPFPASTVRSHDVQVLKSDFHELETKKETVQIAGRILSIREHGGSIFFDLYDGTGTVQGYLKKDVLSTALFSLFRDTVDRGDFIQISGTCFTTKRGEPSVLVSEWQMLSKSLLPIPTEHFGIKDEDERYRKRYLDILLKKELADRIRRRSVFWQSARTFLISKGFIEVETPVLETTPGGADARPFITHHNALDMDVYLRISAGELWQKKLMVAGIPKTFEIGRIFRNEGMSFEHLQDYTQLEFYEAFSDFEKGKELVRELYLHLAQETFQKTVFTIRDVSIDLSRPWETYDFSEIMLQRYGFDPREVDQATVHATCIKEGVNEEDSEMVSIERGVDTLWKKCRTTLIGPGFLVGIPVYLEPLAKRSAQDPRVVERFQVMLAGSEMGKGFSELNDPLDQRERFEHQEELRKKGDDEAQFADMDYVEAMEYGMPPTFGFGTSERLFSFLEGVSVREGQIFPLLRPKK